VTTGVGEIPLRGAHVGDQIVAAQIDGSHWLVGGAEITDCAGPVVVKLRVVAFFGAFVSLVPAGAGFRLSAAADPGAPPVLLRLDRAAEAISLPRATPAAAIAAGPPMALTGNHDLELLTTIYDDEGRPYEVSTEAALRVVPAGAPLQMYSADGRLELQLTAGALPPARQVAIETVLGEPPAPRAAGALLAGPYRVSSAAGDELLLPAWLHINLSPLLTARRGASALQVAVELVAYDSISSAWQPLPSYTSPDPPVVSARIERLGVFALVERREYSHGADRSL
jgi:hypothetical protein